MAYPYTIILGSTIGQPVSLHPLYIQMTDTWKKIRDVVAGQKTIRAAGETYLPRLPRQTDSQYEEYLSRARFFNATRRTIEGLTGLVFRKDPIYKWPRIGKDPFIQDVSRQTQSLSDYSEMLLFETIEMGRGGTLIDYPRVTASKLTVADVEQMNQRPYWGFYPAEAILDWLFEPINNVPTLTRVKLQETIETRDEEDGRGEFRYKTRYKILDLEPYQNSMRYRVRIYDEGEPAVGVSDTPTATIYPKRGREFLDFIPFRFHGPSNKGWVVSTPPINDLTDSNISHYQLKADHYHGLRYASLPQYWTAGVEQDEVPDTVGPHKIWGFTSPEARAGILAYDGKGLQEVREEERTLEHQMAMQGAKLLGTPQGYRESATSSSIRALGETATLGQLTKAVSKQITWLLQITAWWDGLIEKPSRGNVFINLNIDFHPAIMDSQMVLALVNSWQSEAMSKETMFDNFKQGEIIPAERTFEEEMKKIKENPPPEPAEASGNAQGANISREKSPGPAAQK